MKNEVRVHGSRYELVRGLHGVRRAGAQRVRFLGARLEFESYSLHIIGLERCVEALSPWCSNGGLDMP